MIIQIFNKNGAGFKKKCNGPGGDDNLGFLLYAHFIFSCQKLIEIYLMKDKHFIKF